MSIDTCSTICQVTINSYCGGKPTGNSALKDCVTGCTQLAAAGKLTSESGKMFGYALVNKFSCNRYVTKPIPVHNKEATKEATRNVILFSALFLITLITPWPGDEEAAGLVLLKAVK